MSKQPEIKNPWEGRNERYKTIDNERYAVSYTGAFYEQRGDRKEYDALEIAERVLRGETDFSNIIGFYKIVIVNKKSGDLFFWGDNAGSQVFYIDEEGGFCDSFLELIKRREKIKPNYSAIYQTFIGRYFTTQTIVEGICASDSRYYYRVSRGEISPCSKQLVSHESLGAKTSLHDVIEGLYNAMRDEKIAAVITGGTDSRTVLAHLLSLGARPELIITGHEDNPDVAVAKKIAQAVELPLSIINPAEREEGWLQKAFYASDGMYDTVLSYRLYLKALHMYRRGCFCEFDGVGGEFYKNDFFRTFNRAYLSKATPQSIYNNYVSYLDADCGYLGERVLDAREEARRDILNSISSNIENGKLRSYNKACGVSLRHFSRVVCNIALPYCFEIDPLLDDHVIAGVSQQKKPLSLCGYRWQRKQIARYCPKLSDIETDQGYTCSVAPLKYLKETCEIDKGLRSHLNRLRGLIPWAKVKPIKSAPSLWKEDYAAARKTPEFKSALDKCRELGIIAKDCEPPDYITGFVMMIGMVFEYKQAN